MAQRSHPPMPKTPVETLMTPVQEYIKTESSSGIVLISAAVIAFVWANSPFAGSYFALKDMQVGIGFGAWSLEKELILWVNDLLMAMFFFVVGLEIKRELLVGELAGWQKASLPAIGALGGMVVPALIYVLFNLGQDTIRGWGVPMATDIAFALGVLALLGARVPLSLKIFLLALAIVDDLGAVLVIAVFYTDDLSTNTLLVSLAFWMIAVVYGQAHGRSKVVYTLLGALCWYFMLKSGVHATIAGVLMALSIPLRHGMSEQHLREQLRVPQDGDFEALESRISHLGEVVDRAHSPLHAMEHTLAPYVAFFVMPVFAFFNAGVAVIGGGTGAESEAGLIGLVSVGAFLGLLVGKPLGVVGFAWLAVASGISRFPPGANWTAFLGIGLLAGIGFTMSLFIANLAFPDPGILDQAKIGVLAASTFAAVAGYRFLDRSLPKATDSGSVASSAASAPGREG